MVSIRKKAPAYGRIKFSSIDEYHASFPAEIQKLLQQLRQAIRQAAPQATETISYNIPTFKMNKNLVHYAAHKDHIGFYPASRVITVFKEELTGFRTSKGTIQFPLEEPLPIALIKKIVRYRITEDAAKTKTGHSGSSAF
jgi:uncharacterized protein YdhG (YjbR/CyaY superfamily)